MKATRSWVAFGCGFLCVATYAQSVEVVVGCTTSASHVHGRS
jgi:hypothetical protein